MNRVSSFAVGNWYHYVGVADGSVLRTYVNGVSVGEPLAYNGTIRTNSSVIVDIARSTVNYPFNGPIDDVRIYNRALTGNEVARLYSMTSVDKKNNAVYSGTKLVSNPKKRSYLSEYEWRPSIACVFNGTDDYVNTGITFDSNSSVELYLQTNIKGASDSSFHYYFSVFENNGSTPWLGFWKNNGPSYGVLGYNTQSKNFAIVNGWSFFKITKDWGIYNGVTNIFTSPASTVGVTRPLYLGTANNAGTPWSVTWAPMEVTRWQIATNGVLVQDCKAQSNGTFKDSVSGTIISRGGGGSLSTVNIQSQPFTRQKWFNE
jgi:hypothetical protein